MKQLRRIIFSALAMLSLLLCSATCVLWAKSRHAPPVPTCGQTGCSEIQWQHALARNCPEIQFQSNNLVDVIDFYRDVSGFNILVDWPALAAIRIVPQTPITLNFKNESFGSVLTRTARAANKGLRIVERDGAIYITTTAAQTNDSHVERRVVNPLIAEFRRLHLQPPVSLNWEARIGSHTATVMPSPEALHIQLNPSDAMAAYQDDIPLGDGTIYGRNASINGKMIFSVAHLSLNHAPSPFHSWEFTAPYWELVLLFSLTPVLYCGTAFHRRRNRARNSAAAGQWSTCGYDLRATPTRSPECGTSPTKTIAV